MSGLPNVSFELISADSRQVYRGFDVGTAKPSPSERWRIPHHLIDICDPDESFDVGKFVEACDTLVPEIQRRGAVPIISGGTAFYLQGYLFGLPGTPSASREVRDRLQERCDREGLSPLREELRTVDPVAEARIAANDEYRVLRALEVYYTTGKPLSSYTEPREVRPGIEALILGLTRDREELYQRINARVDKMFDEGLVEEVSRLLATSGIENSPAFRGIGYREFLEHGGTPPWSVDAVEAIRDRIARDTRRYAKRQELFFRRIPAVEWIQADDQQRVLRRIEEWLRVHAPSTSKNTKNSQP